jgi:hypothetical protein
MPTLRIELRDAVPEALRGEIQEKLGYLSPAIRRAAVEPRLITLEITDDADLAALEADARKIAAAMCRGHRDAPAAKLWSARRDLAPTDPWPELQRLGLVFEHGPGLIGLAADAVRVLEALRARIGRLATRFGAEARQFPTLISIETLNRCSYFSSFPHHVTFAPHVRENLQSIEDVSKNVGGEIGRFLDRPTHVLSPAVCFHAYRELADAPLTAPRVFTATGRCARYESLNLSRLERSWEFSMQEIIFVGDKEHVSRSRQAALDEVCGWMQRWGLSCWLELATDPFFMTTFAAKRYHQLLSEAKYELKLDLGGGRSLAAASFNVHSDFFGQSFGIALPAGGSAHTGCVAFGLERWLWALWTQLGPAVSAWPAVVRDELQL